MNHAVQVRQYEDHPQLKPCKVLLEFEVPIHRQQYLETVLRTAKKLAVLDTLPAQPGDGTELMADQLCGQVDWQVLVKQNAHC